MTPGRREWICAASRIAAHYSAGLYTLHPLSIKLAGGNATLTWSTGTLQQADFAASPYTDVATGSTYTVSAGLAKKFYRVRF